MSITHIFIISSHLMFSHGLESLLRQETDFDIVGQEKDMERAIEQIKELQPDVIILDSDNAVSQVTPILHTNPDIKIISLNLQNNDLYVYQAKQQAAKETEDLVKAIKDDLHNIKTLGRKGHDNEEHRKYSG